MGYLKQSDIESVLSAADIADIVQRYIPLRANGANFKALCPFHSEKTPSFMVNRAKQIYHCFGCGVGGNVFSFVMQYEKVSFPESVRIIADMLGMHISMEEGRREEKRVDYSGMNAAAAEFFHRELFSERGLVCRDFLKNRGIIGKTAKDFYLGFAPRLPGALLGCLREKGFSEEDILSAGLAVERTAGPGFEGRDRVIDKFRGRAMFPVRNPAGKVIGFSGRCLDEGDIPKYLNTPETPLFRKREILYGFYEARKAILEKEYAVLVEGHIDVIMAHQAGLDNTVGVQGTAFTSEHATRLKNYTKKVIVCFDGDDAGIEAAKKTLPLFLSQEMDAEAVLLPEGEDPASLVQKSGRDGLMEHFRTRKPLFNFKLDNLRKSHKILRPENKVDIIKSLFSDLSQVTNRVMRDEYFRKLAAALDVDEQTLRQDYSEFGTSQKLFSSLEDPKEQSKDAYLPGELELLKLIVCDREYLLRLREEAFDPEAICGEDIRGIFRVLLDRKEDIRGVRDMIVLLQENADAVRLVSQLASEDVSGDKEAVFGDCLRDIRLRRVRRRQEEIKAAIRAQEQKGEDVTALLKEFQGLLSQTEIKR